ncbi:MAG: SH3 domain-containing protein [Spirochaetales bacterium]|nr:SH3 domain-containing protein [Spirochaetales bacterium]
MKKNMMVLLFVCMSIAGFSQATLIREFPFGNDFRYEEKTLDDRSFNGIQITFIHNSYCLSSEDSAFFYDYRHRFISGKRYSFKEHRSAELFTGTYWLDEARYYGYLNGNEFRLFYRFGNHSEYKVYEMRELLNLSSYGLQKLYYREGYLFAESSCGLFSFELKESGEYVYRNISDTHELLNQGLGEKLNFSDEFVNPSDEFDSSTFERIDNTGLKYYPGESWKIGTDSKGLSYVLAVYSYSDRLESEFVVREKKLYFIVYDPWEKKVLYKYYPGAVMYDYCKIADYRSGGDFFHAKYNGAVHSNGDLYFTTVDMSHRKYQLWRIENTWWEELGANKKEIVRIDGNRIPLYKEARLDAELSGYNYQDDYVWVKKRESNIFELDGEQVSWLYVAKRDGREGWILSNQVYSMPDEKEIEIYKSIDIYYGVINREKAILQKNEVLSSDDSRVLPIGTIVEIVDRSMFAESYYSGHVFKIKLSDGTIGWVRGLFVDEYDHKPVFGILNDFRVRLRTEPNLSSLTVKYLDKDEIVEIIGRSKEKQKIGEMEAFWLKVRLKDGTEGWVYGYFVDMK